MRGGAEDSTGGDAARLLLAINGRIDERRLDETLRRRTEKLSQLFKQFGPHRAGRQGSGMGLTICKKIVERHGGRIWVDATLPNDATFRFSLPSVASSET